MKVVFNKNRIAMDVLGTQMGPIELASLGNFYGLTGEHIDLQVGIICEREGVWRCDTCDAWVEEAHMHNDICHDCYAEDHDE
jgi:hypothetical protein